MRLLKFLFLLVILAGIAAGAGWMWFQSEINKPGPTTAETIFVVEKGQGLGTVASKLETEGIITDANKLQWLAQMNGAEASIKAGEFRIASQASVSDVLNVLVEGKGVLYRITIPEGLTTAQALKVIDQNDNLTGDLPEEMPPEGVLMTDTYLFNRGLSKADLIERMKDAQTEFLDEHWPQRADDIPVKTREEAIKLASIVEKETGANGEQSIVAGVFTTRMKRGMRLESDPTIIYGVSKGEPLYNKRGERRTLYRSEIDRKTDWNTYQIDGLPKTPICNPGKAAILAVLNPPESEYLFFMADGKGGHVFSETYAQHLKAVKAYRKFEREEIARERGN
jgi:UPF0755 protein